MSLEKIETEFLLQLKEDIYLSAVNDDYLVSDLYLHKFPISIVCEFRFLANINAGITGYSQITVCRNILTKYETLHR